MSSSLVPARGLMHPIPGFIVNSTRWVKNTIQLAFYVVGVSTTAGIVNVLLWISPRTEVLIAPIGTIHVYISSWGLTDNQYKQGFTFRKLRAIFWERALDANKSVYVRNHAVNLDLHRMDPANTPCKLFDFVNDSRPLVINFGSST